MVLHPSFKDEYFKLANWQPEWIQEAIRLTREMWESMYKPPPHPTTTQQPNTGPQAGILAGLRGASEAHGASTTTYPLTMWLSGGLVLNKDGQPVDPLRWWMQQ
ncbi:hypothetical protein PCANC_16849 [Puccinia coronata f. sp. avenae]|uniref:Uncharacterized protein n=1 Tax=Puccinia coronata f. sp. avenae TaxID=200324 RepID=A0A2N5SSP2_9BASI|nr:hypothetical protein PCANC_16849 [Puccinia coronata f. sp. avenae]